MWMNLLGTDKQWSLNRNEVGWPCKCEKYGSKKLFSVLHFLMIGLKNGLDRLQSTLFPVKKCAPPPQKKKTKKENKKKTKVKNLIKLAN